MLSQPAFLERAWFGWSMLPSLYIVRFALCFFYLRILCLRSRVRLVWNFHFCNVLQKFWIMVRLASNVTQKVDIASFLVLERVCVRVAAFLLWMFGRIPSRSIWSRSFLGGEVLNYGFNYFNSCITISSFYFIRPLLVSFIFSGNLAIHLNFHRCLWYPLRMFLMF